MAKLYGIGVGTGDPELLTLKAIRLIQTAPVVSYLSNHDGYSQAREIARLAFEQVEIEQQELAIAMPMQLDRKAANQVYDQATIQISACLEAGMDVAFLCEGDPLFYGSFAYVLERLHNKYVCEVVPGISTLHSASAVLQQPLTRLGESLIVLNSRHSDAQILQALEEQDSLVIMKVARHRARIKALLEQSGRMQDARYLEYIGRDNQNIEVDINQLSDEGGVYFSVILVTRQTGTLHAGG